MDKSVKDRFFKKVSKRPDKNGCLVWLAGRTEYGYGRFCFHGKTQRAHRFAWEMVWGVIPVGYDILHSCDNPPCVNIYHLGLGTPKDNSQDAKNKGRLAMGDRNGSHTKPERRPRGDRNGSHTKPEQRPRGDRNGSRTKPERRPRGERHGYHTHPESVPRGDKHWSRTNPDRVARGKRHGSYTKPECVARGEQIGNSKLNEKAVIEIRRQFRSGSFTKVALAKKYGVSHGAIWLIITGQRWKHVPLGG